MLAILVTKEKTLSASFKWRGESSLWKVKSGMLGLLRAMVGMNLLLRDYEETKRNPG
jgi:hypothetical protein